MKIFAGQRDDAFFGDIGAIFDLLGFRKAGTTGNMGGGKDFFAGYNVHAVALQIPISQLDNSRHTIGIWSSTDRQNVTVGGKLNRGWTQVSRLGNPLINEVIIPTSLKDAWNRGQPAQDAKYLKYYTNPLLAATINTVYKLGVPATNRDDLVAVLLTGIPNVTFTGARPADMLRINLAVPVTPAGKVSRLGVLGGDNQGWPNGRRLGDDVIDIAEQAVAGFLKGKKLPLGDGVNSGDVAEPRRVPVRGAPGPGLRQLEGTAEAIGPSSQGGGPAPPPALPPMRNTLLIATATIFAAGAFVLFGGVLRESPSAGASALPAERVAVAFDPAFSSAQNAAALVLRLQQQIRQSPDDAASHALLGLAYQQRARETGDAAYYPRAETVLQAGARAGRGERRRVLRPRLARPLAAPLRRSARPRAARPRALAHGGADARRCRRRARRARPLQRGVRDLRRAGAAQAWPRGVRPRLVCARAAR